VTAYGRVQEALHLLSKERPDIGAFSGAPIGPDRNVREARLAKDYAGGIHLLVELPPGRARFELPLGDVLPTQWLDRSDNDESPVILDVASTDPGLTPTFLSLVGEMLSRVDQSGAHCIDELMRVLGAWREALANVRRGLSRQRAAGLFGELTVLAKLAETDPARAKAAWRGKEGYRHDFFLRNALEVKAYTGVDAPSVTIHGAYQLDPPAGADLHLLAIRLEENAEGETIADLIERVDSLGLPKGLLFERSSPEDPVVSDDSLRFVVASERLFEVGADFPGIRASAVGDAALKGVAHLRYALLLDTCPGEIDASDLEKVLSRL